MSFPLSMMMKWYWWWEVNFSLLEPYTSAVSFSKDPSWINPPIWSNYIWSVVWNTLAPMWMIKMQQLITLSENTIVDFTFSVDNSINLYIDWINVYNFNDPDDTSNYATHKTLWYSLSKWTHRILCYWWNNWWPAWLALTIRRKSDNTLLLWTDNNWKITTNPSF